jgi:hypothetical protein
MVKHKLGPEIQKQKMGGLILPAHAVEGEFEGTYLKHGTTEEVVL